MILDWFFIVFFLSWAVLRVSFVFLITRFACSRWAMDRLIYRISVPYEQYERERYWAVPFFVDALGFGLLAYVGYLPFTEWGVFPTVKQTSNGLIWLALAHIFIAEPLYYGYHLLLHRIPTLRRHHVKHHTATIPSPPSGYTFTLFERVSYLVLFAVPILAVAWIGQLTPLGFFGYFLAFDFLNSIGHCNIEFFPKWYVNSPFKWLVYSPSYHSLHHSRWETNYALFMPIYDWIFGTVAPESDELFNRAHAGQGPHDLRRLMPSPASGLGEEALSA